MKTFQKLAFAVTGLAVAVSFTSAKPAAAAFIDAPVPDNAKITFNGLEWAWANPCAPTQPTCGEIDLSYQSQFGWRLPTLDELLSKRPSALDFIFPGANVPQGGSDPVSGANFQAGFAPGDGAVAVPYFSNIYNHADWGDGFNNLWAGLPGDASYYETLVVRDIQSTPVPTPALLPGLVGMGIAALRKRKGERSEAAEQA